MTKIINLYGGPGIGKSTLAAGIFYEMKSRGLSVELVTEYIKSAVWEQRTRVIEDQLYVLAKQTRKISIILGQVDYIVSDSPILLTLVYCKDQSICNLAKKLHSEHHTLDIVIPREFEYVDVGRLHSEKEAYDLDARIHKLIVPHIKPEYTRCIDYIIGRAVSG